MVKVGSGGIPPPKKRKYIPQLVEDLFVFSANGFVDKNQYDIAGLPGDTLENGRLKVDVQIIGESHVVAVFLDGLAIFSEVIACVNTCEGYGVYPGIKITDLDRYHKNDCEHVTYKLHTRIGKFKSLAKAIRRIEHDVVNSDGENDISVHRAFKPYKRGQHKPRTCVVVKIKKTKKGIRIEVDSLHEYMPQGKACVTHSEIYPHVLKKRTGGNA